MKWVTARAKQADQWPMTRTFTFRIDADTFICVGEAEFEHWMCAMHAAYNQDAPLASPAPALLHSWNVLDEQLDTGDFECVDADRLLACNQHFLADYDAFVRSNEYSELALSEKDLQSLGMLFEAALAKAQPIILRQNDYGEVGHSI